MRIIAAAVIAIVEHELARQWVAGAVPERIITAFCAERHQYGPMRDSAQRKDYGPPRQGLDLFAEIGVAAADLGGFWPVRGREALYCIGDAAADKS